MADYRQVAAQKAKKYGLDPAIFQRQIQQESGFNPNARSGAGAQGIAQIMPATAKGWGVNPADPVASLDAAAKNMASYVKKYGSYKNALVAYNAGPGRVGGSLPAETQNYIKVILGGSNPTGLSSPSAASTGTVRTSTPTASASNLDVDLQAKRQVLLSYLENRDDPRAALTLAMGLQQLKQEAATGTAAQATSYSPDAGTPVNTTSASTSAAGTVNFEGKKVAAWIAPALAYARKRGWKGQVNSGYRSFADQTRIYNSGVRPAAKPGTSNHEGDIYPRGAIDVSDAQQLSSILQRSPYAKKLVYAGAKDPVHFSHPHNGSY